MGSKKLLFLEKIRRLMQHSVFVAEPLQAYIIPHEDAHMSEYLVDCEKRVTYASGFTGSEGTCIVTPNQALLWTDGRYHTQAEEQLDSDLWTLMKFGLESTPSEMSWLISNLPPASKVGLDPKLITYLTWLDWEKQLTNHGHSLVPVKGNLVDAVWEDKPPFVAQPIVSHPVKYSGANVLDKINQIKTKMTEKDADVIILSALDEIAWTLNLRGSDIPYNPVFFSYMCITQEGAHLFVKRTDVPKDFICDYESFTIKIHEYDEIFSYIEKEILQKIDKMKKIWIPNSMNYCIYSMIPEKKRLCDCSPVLFMKAIKNETEIEGMVQAHIKDATALCRYFAWLEQEVPKGYLTEITAADKLETFRKDEADYVGPSFPTISSSGPNGAIIHYQPTKESDRKLSCDELYLCDSGAQFYQGTTDVTRTVHFGTPTPFEKEAFTRVFKGQTALACTIFPHKLKGNYLDSFARKSLWDVGLDYLHGTSHGVGSYLHVHEGPVGISWRARPDDPGLQANMILSNEPGFYEKNSFGIRLENLVQIVPAETQYKHQHSHYLTFKTLTLVPVQIKMLEPSLLTKNEIDYLNEYHETCRNVIGTILKNRGYSDAFDWLMRETQPLS